MDKEEIVAMAVACIAEQTGTDMKNVRVLSFKEIVKSPLMHYISDNDIKYKKYELEDEAI